MSARRLLIPVALLAIALTVPLSAGAVLPRPNRALVAHKHNTGGHDYHVEIDIGKDPRKVKAFVLYSQECDKTVFKPNLRLHSDGTFHFNGTIGKDKGTWDVVGRFTDFDHAVGTFSLSTTSGCEVKDQSYIMLGPGAGGHYVSGLLGEYPNAKRMRGTSKAARYLRHVWRATLRTAHRFDTLKKTRKLGYVPDPIFDKQGKPLPGVCPGTYHSRKRVNGKYMWGKVLDANAPQSIVWWCDASGKFTLIGYMYRADASPTPKSYHRLIQWHKHSPKGGWMTHVWLVQDPVAAWATCMPFRAFEAEHLITYDRYQPSLHNSFPCSDTDYHGEPPVGTPGS